MAVVGGASGLRQLSISLHSWDEKEKKNTPSDLLLPSCTGWNNDGEATAGNSKWELFKQVSSITRKRSSDADSSPFSPATPSLCPLTSTLCLPPGGSEAIREKVSLFLTKSPAPSQHGALKRSPAARQPDETLRKHFTDP